MNYRSPDRDYTVQVSFTHIYPERFDWLICGHKDERRFWHILLFSQEQVARGFFLNNHRLTYTLSGGRRPEVRRGLITYNALYALFDSGSLERTVEQTVVDSAQALKGELRDQSHLIWPRAAIRVTKQYAGTLGHLAQE